MDNYNEKYPKDEEFRLRFNREASDFYREKMIELIDNDRTRIGELRGYVNGLDLVGHWMYRIDTLQSEDGHRAYEFLIEYDTDSPSEGIYYGCRGITNEGFDHEKEIEQFRKEWDEIKATLCIVLNNIFPDKDYSLRFKKTDNANTNTYWLFWITLNDDEDIKEVGVTATQMIRDVFKLYFEKKITCTEKYLVEKSVVTKTSFFNANYDELLEKVKNRDVFENFIKQMETNNWIVKDIIYEKAWRFKGEGKHNENVDFAAILKLISHAFNDNKTPWAQIEHVFLDGDGKAFVGIRQQSNQLKNDIMDYWKEQLLKKTNIDFT